MFQRAVAHGAIVGIAAALASVAMPCLANDAAHKMAEKFAEPSPAATSDAATKREPTRAQDEARKDAQRKAEAARRAAQAKREAAAKAGDARRKAELLKADEMDMLARARLEAEERRAAEEEERLTTEARRLIELAAQERAKAEELLAGHPDAAKPAGREPSVAESSRPQPAADRSATEPSPVKETDEETLSRRRAEEAKRLAEKLQRVRQIRESRLARETQRQPDPPEPQAAPTPSAPPPSAIGAAPAQPGTDQAPVAAAPAFERPRVERLDPPSDAAAVPPPVRPSEVAASPAGTGQVDKDPQPRPVAPPPREQVAHAPVEPPSRTVTQPADTRPDEPRAQPDPERRSRLGAAPTRAPAAERTGAYGRVAVLLVMEPGNYGIRRRGPKVADPLLCMHHGCYVSAGADQPAVFLPGRKALGLGNTFGKRAGACRKSLTCVFRDVELGGLPGYLQPVDLHILKHDLRAGHAILADSDCRIDAGRLLCRHGIEAADYTMWIVPEELADAAGPEVLQRALTDRLALPRSAALAPRP